MLIIPSQDKTTTISPLVLLKYLRAAGFEPLLISLSSTPPELGPDISAFLSQAPATTTGGGESAGGGSKNGAKSKKSGKKEKPKKKKEEGTVNTPQPIVGYRYPRSEHYAGLSDADAAKLNQLRAAAAQQESTRYMLAKIR